MYRFNIPNYTGVLMPQLRRFVSWRSLFPVCELTSEVSTVLSNASRIAREAGSGLVESEFVLKSLLSSGYLRGRSFHGIPLTVDFLKTELDSFIRTREYTGEEERIGNNSASALLYAQSLALSRHKPVGPDELAEGLVKYDPFLRGLRRHRESKSSATQDCSDDYCIVDLTAKAKSGNFGNLIGREDELRRLKGSLYRMRKNNVLLVGDPGVGKTAIVERLALDLLNEGKGVTVFSLDLCSLYSGHGTRGGLEAKLKSVFDRIGGGDTILFIDEIHHLLQNQDNGLNVTNLFKPIMTGDSVKIIGSTTTKEYHRYFRHDRAFERRFQVLRIRENSVDESLVILYGVRPQLESYHEVHIGNDAIVASVELSRRFLPKLLLPDKAIDLLDEASMLAKRQCYSCSAQSALTRRKNRLILDLIHNRDSEAARNEMNAIEKCEYEIIARKSAQHTLRHRLQELQQQQQEYEKTGELAKASELKNHVIPGVLKSLTKLNRASLGLVGTSVPSDNDQRADASTGDGTNCVRELCDTTATPEQVVSDFTDVSTSVKVDKFTVAKVVSEQTGIPECVILQSHTPNYETILDILNSSVLGQADAVRRTVLHLFRHIHGCASRNGVAGALCYVGPPGVGKRTLLRSISTMLGFGLKYISCSKLVDCSANNILVGSPPGYVGHHEGGILCEWVKEHPYSMIVFEDAHLMHANAGHLLMSAIEKGLIVDNQGEDWSLGQCFFVFTFCSSDEVPQFIRDNVDDVIEFSVLDKETMKELIYTKLSKLPMVRLQPTLAAVEHLYTMSTNLGAVTQAIDGIVGNGICRLVVSGALGRGASCSLRLRCESKQATERELDISNDLVLVINKTQTTQI
ncbi:ATP-dependent chaperone ClpB [Babesia caballi]|uniref:ATP-dependent chaperone ClpB n=1 Tax=Babesia caballi TaxID=5871 RepID=A0AAV4LWP4_BABCB|nr:ATP-dependent chaperone ClpB [Babesia caballi]